MFRAVRPIFAALLIATFVVGQSSAWLHVAAHIHSDCDSRSHECCHASHCHSHTHQNDDDSDHTPSESHDPHTCSICHWYCQPIDISIAPVDLHLVGISVPLVLRKLDASPLLDFVRVFSTRGPPALVTSV